MVRANFLFLDRTDPRTCLIVNYPEDQRRELEKVLPIIPNPGYGQIFFINSDGAKKLLFNTTIFPPDEVMSHPSIPARDADYLRALLKARKALEIIKTQESLTSENEAKKLQELLELELKEI